MSSVADQLELLPCSFKFYDFNDKVGEVRISCQIIKMDKSLYVWVGDCNEKSMKDLALAFAMENNPKKLPVTTKILGSIADEISTNIASRLASKYGKPVYVSFNLTVDNLILPRIERRIHEEFKQHPELLNL